MSDPHVHVALMTWNPVATGRIDYFRRAHAGYSAEAPVTVVTTGADDATVALVRDQFCGLAGSGSGSAGRSMMLGIEACLAAKADIVTLSADDVVPVAGWLSRLVSFWMDAPDDVKLATLFVEDGWTWNRISSAAAIGSERVLFRESVPGSSWSFRASDWPLIGPIEHKTGGEDLATCRRLRANGYRLAALDLAEHAAPFQSAWGNRSQDYAVPTNRIAWGLPAQIGAR